MIRRIFTWFFCNLYYFYARKKSKDSDMVVVASIGVILGIPVGLIGTFTVLAINNFQLGKKETYMMTSLIYVPFLIFFVQFFYKSKRYLKLLENFPEEKYNKYIFLYAVLFFIVIPGGIFIGVAKYFS